MKYASLARFRELDEKRKSSNELRRIGSTPIKILVLATKRPIGDVRQDHHFGYMTRLITIVVESQNTMLLVITYHLGDPGLLLGGG